MRPQRMRGRVTYKEGIAMTLELAIFGRDWWNHAHQIAKELREKGAVHPAMLPWGEQKIPVFVITRYAEARAALGDPRLSKDGAGLVAILNRHLTVDGVEPELSAMFKVKHPIFLDPPEHKRLRDLLQKHFTRTRMEAMRPRIEQMVGALLDELPVGREVDLITDLAFPLPLNVICELIGVPEKKRGLLRAWTFALMEDNPERARKASENMYTYLVELIETARANPGEDLLSALVQDAEDEDRLSQEELLGILYLLFVAGHETTTALIGNGIKGLLERPALYRELALQPHLLPRAVKEFSRHEAAVATTTHRFTTEEIIIDGTIIPAGEIVLISLLSANRDERHFHCPEQLDIHRTESNLAFGYGIHYCLGALLGSIEAESVWGALARRFPNAHMAVEADQLVRRQPVMIPWSYRELPTILG
jgi:cytochrome P450